MKRMYKTVLIKQLLIMSIIIFNLIYLLGINHQNSDNIVILTFIINLIYIIIKLVIEEKKDYSFKIIFWLFNLIFLCISPMFQYLSNTYVLENIIFTDDIFIRQNLIILMYMIIFNFSYKLSYNNKNIKSSIIFSKFTEKSYKMSIPILLIILLITLIIAGPKSMFIRDSGYKLVINVMGVDIGSILVEALIYTACIVTLINIDALREKRNLLRYIRVIIGIMTIILIAFPTGKPRFIVGTVYLGLFLYIKKKFKNKSTFIIVFISVFLLIMPSLSNSRSYDSISDNIENFKIVNPYDYLKEGDSSSYVMGLSGIKYLEDNKLLYGKQMVSNILFFIPRSIWPSKMVSLGSWLAEYSNHSHNNMDSPLFIEFFIDFGYIGLIIFTIILGTICSKLDYKFWNICVYSNENYFLKYVYPFLIVIFFFVNRGAFLSTFARTVNLLLGLSIIRIIYKNYKINV